jgi:Na(+)-translocating NADH:ubiquinone oxidoreductase A subunit
VGALLTNVFAGNVNKDKELRYISGNVLTGRKISANSFLGAFHNQLTVIPEGNDIHEFLGWIMPRLNQFSVSHSYFSWLLGKKKEYALDARVKGGERHMIMSNEYDRVFPHYARISDKSDYSRRYRSDGRTWYIRSCTGRFCFVRVCMFIENGIAAYSS